MNYPGTHGTTYDDWSKDLIRHHGNRTSYQRDGDTIQAYVDDTPVGAFNFKNSTGFVIKSNEVGSLNDFEPLENFQEIMLDDVVRH
jgi:hypothetical protein